MIRLLAWALLGAASCARAQAPAFQPRVAEVSLDYRYVPPHALLHPREGVAGDPSVRVRPYLIKARVSRSWKIDALEGTLTSSFGYERLQFEYDNWDSARDASRVDALNSLQFMLGFIKRLNERWSLRLLGGPSLNSDLKAVTAKSLRATAVVGFDCSLDGRDKLGLGLAYVQIFGKNMGLPGISYQRRRESYRVDLMAPARAGVYWLPRQDADLGLLLNFSGNNYRIEAPGELNGKRVEYSLGTLGPSLIWRLRPGWSWTLDTGAVLRHRYAIMDGNSLYRSLDMKRSVFFALGAKAGF